MPSTNEALTWVHVDNCEPLNKTLFELCLAHKKIIMPIDLAALFNVYDDESYGNTEHVHPNNTNLLVKTVLTKDEKFALRKILKTSGNLGKLREIDYHHTENSTRHVEDNTNHLIRLTKIQIWIGVIQMSASIGALVFTILQYVR